MKNKKELCYHCGKKLKLKTFCSKCGKNNNLTTDEKKLMSEVAFHSM